MFAFAILPPSWSLFAAVLVVATLVEAPHARACGATPCALWSNALPHKGASSVPLDTEVRAQVFGTWREGESRGGSCRSTLKLRLVPDGADPIELPTTVEVENPTVAWLIGRPLAPLLAQTHYEIEVESPDFGSCSCEVALNWTALSDFTTGTDADQESPQFDGISSITSDPVQHFSSDCGTTYGYSVTPSFTPAKDDSIDVRYQLYVDGQLTQRYVNPSSYKIFVYCDTNAALGTNLITPDAMLELRAVDLAGKLSSPHAALAIVDLCPNRAATGSPSNGNADATARLPAGGASDVVGPMNSAGAGGAAARAHSDSSGCSASAVRSSRRATAALLCLLISLATIVRAPKARTPTSRNR